MWLAPFDVGAQPPASQGNDHRGRLDRLERRSDRPSPCVSLSSRKRSPRRRAFALVRHLVPFALVRWCAVRLMSRLLSARLVALAHFLVVLAPREPGRTGQPKPARRRPPALRTRRAAGPDQPGPRPVQCNAQRGLMRSARSMTLGVDEDVPLTALDGGVWTRDHGAAEAVGRHTNPGGFHVRRVHVRSTGHSPRHSMPAMWMPLSHFMSEMRL